MQPILDFIAQKAREMEQSPILVFMRDQSIDPRQRFSFMPILAPWVFGFADLNKYALRVNATQDPIQQVINAHTVEDDDHWEMYLKDLRTLGMNDTMDFATALKLLWGDESRKTRQVVYDLWALIIAASPVMRIVILKAIEEASAANFKILFEAGEEFRRLTGERLHYFGDQHIDIEANHSMRTAEAEEQFTVELTPEQEKEARAIVEKVFQLILDMTNEFLAYARRYPRPMQGLRAAGQQSSSQAQAK